MDVPAVLRAIDARTASLRLATGLACPSGCGRCCHSPDVQALEVELAPLAEALVARGEGAHWLARVGPAPAAGPCMLFEPDPADATRGRCREYALRPSICRTFGFAARRGRDGATTLSTCAHLRTHDADAVERAEAYVGSGGDAPVWGEAALALAALDPGRGAEPLPINEALRRALTRAGLAASLRAGAALADAAPAPLELVPAIDAPPERPDPEHPDPDSPLPPVAA